MRSPLFTEAKALPILGVAERLGLTLLHQGRTVFTSCPTHAHADGVDSNPSCSLNPVLNRFRCWSCGNAGSTIDLVAQVHRCSLTEAARWLTGQHDLPAPALMPGTMPSLASVQAMLEDLITLCGELSPAARRYLESRGIAPRVVTECRITDVSDYSTVERGLAERHHPRDLVAAGVFSAKGHFRLYGHRLAFPFLQAARPVYLTARRLGSDEKPKYINLNGPVPGLYNEDVLEQGDPVWLTEGVMDCLTLTSEGLPTVAVIGAFTFKPAWASLFSGREVILALDGDDAGRAGSRHISELLRAAGAGVSVARLPEGMDVNAYYCESGLVPEVEEHTPTAR